MLAEWKIDPVPGQVSVRGEGQREPGSPRVNPIHHGDWFR